MIDLVVYRKYGHNEVRGVEGEGRKKEGILLSLLLPLLLQLLLLLPDWCW